MKQKGYQLSADDENLFPIWFQELECSIETVRVLKERKEARESVLQSLVNVAADHVIGLKAIESLGGFPKSTHILKHRLPAGKIARSGMLGEILATEFVERETEYFVPVRRLRYRDTRELAMRGDDVLGFRLHKRRILVIKVEAKSRAKLDSATIGEARTGLANHKGHPNPETLAFLECTLRMHDRDTDAEPITALQTQSTRASDICHLIFTLSGNNPTNFLEANSDPIHEGIELRLCGCHITKHADFVKDLFDACLAKGEDIGDS